MFCRSSCVVFAFVLASLTPAQTLKPGDAAPPLSIAKWVKGEPVESFAENKVYVVEFWATWCGPCLASIPHLTQVQKEYGDRGVTVIGVTSEDPNNSLEAVEKLVAARGDGMGYHVAWDDGRKTNRAYMQAAGQNGIPCAFLIDQKGKIAWIGHPALLELPLGMVLGGSWDPVEGQKRIAEVMQKVNEAASLVQKDPASAVKQLDALVEKWPSLAGLLAEVRYGALVEAGETDRAHELGKQVVDKAIAGKDPQALNQFAWSIVDPEAQPKSRDLDLALTAAKKAVEFTEQRDANILDTLARVWFWKQDYKQAVALQEKAAELSSDESIHETLEEYHKLAAESDR